MALKKYLSFQNSLYAIAIIGMVYYVFFHNSNPEVKPLQAPAVIVQKPKPQKRSEYITLTGNVAAFQSVDLVARVEGYLQQINFKDGSYVKKGKLLFVIEPEPYLEKLKEAKASLASEKAGLAYAESEYARQQRMYRQNATSLNSVEKWRSKRDQEKANLAQAKANVTTAEINYSYTHVLAPFDGRIGRHLVDKNNLVGNGQATTLATIEQINPIYVYFNLNELDLLKLRKAAKNHGISSKDINKMPVEVAMQSEKGFPHKGYLDFVNTDLNTTTGTIEFRAKLENKNYPLLPGLFVKVRIPLTIPKLRLTVPDEAINYDQVGPYLLLVNKNNTVVLQRVSLGDVENGYRTILKGLNSDALVITQGLQYASPGNPVEPKINPLTQQANTKNNQNQNKSPKASKDEAKS